MPGGDGTGPRGIGPMTGGGRGYCVAPVSEIRTRPFGRRQFGEGCGRGWRNQFYATGFLKEELKAIQDRIETLEKAQASAE